MLIWMRNMQKCKMPINRNFSHVRGHENPQFFSTDYENQHQLTTGHMKFKNLLIWMRNMQNCEMPKNDYFSQVRGHENLQCFRLSEKALKMMEITPSWPQDTWNVNIWPFGWEICKNVRCPKMTFFAGPWSWKSSIFSTFWKAS